VFVIATNAAALRAQNAIRQAQAGVQKSMERISTGKRINSPADDPANYFIAARMAADIQGMNQASRNVQDGLSLAQTADGALGDVTSMIQRIHELAIAAASGTYSDDDRANMQIEVGQLATQIGQVLSSTAFNGIALFQPASSGGGDVTIQAGANGGDTGKVGLETYDPATLSQLSVATAADASRTMTLAEGLLKATDTSRARLGASMSALSSSMNVLENSVINETDAYDRIMDVDYGAETMALARNQLILNAATAMLAQANTMPRKFVAMLLDPGG
jgi:flagellin